MILQSKIYNAHLDGKVLPHKLYYVLSRDKRKAAYTQAKVHFGGSVKTHLNLALIYDFKQSTSALYPFLVFT